MGDQATEYEIIAYSPEFRDRLLLLQRRSWGPDLAGNSNYFKWKYEDNPHGDQPLVYLALFDGEVVGMRGFWDINWQINNDRIPAVCAGDLVVTHEHENKGLFRKIMGFAETDLASRGYQYLLNLSASPVTFLHSLRNGWKVIQPWQTVRLETGPWETIQRTHARMIKLPYLWRLENSNPAQDILKKLHRAMTGNRIGDVVISDESRPDAMAAVAARNASSKAITHGMDADYLRWRFRSPVSEYQFFYLGEDELQGYLVMETRRAGSHGHCAVVDWRGDEPSAKQALIQAAIAATRPAAISIWTVSRSEEDKEILQQAGFHSIDETRGIKRYQPALLIKPLIESTEAHDLLSQQISDPENWDSHMLFSDKY